MTDSSDYKEMYTTLQQLSKGYVPNNEKRDKLLSITILDFSDTDLEELPDSVNYLTNLQKLSLKGCNIISLPKSVGELEYLQEVDLRNTGITLLSPVLDILSNLHSLRVLRLGNMQVSSVPDSIFSLSSLQILDLSNTLITEISDKFNALCQLEELNLSYSSIEELPPSVGKLASLRKLDLENTKIVALPELKELKLLTSLNLSNTAISALPEHIGELESLRELLLRETPIEILPPSIGRLKNLRSLILGSSQLSAVPKTIDNLSGLEYLDLSETRITTLPGNIGGLKKLLELYLTGTPITTLPESLGDLPRIEELDLERTSISKLPESIKKLSSLKSLDLSGTKLRVLPESLAHLKNLQNLVLEDAILPEIPIAFASGNWKFQFIKSAPRADEAPNLRTADIWCRGLRLKKQNIAVFEAGTEIIKDFYAVDKGKNVREINVFFFSDSQTERAQTINAINQGPVERQYPGAQSDLVQIQYLERKRYAMRLGLWNFTDEAIEVGLYRCFLQDDAVYVVMVHAVPDLMEKARFWLEKIRYFTNENVEILLVVFDDPSGRGEETLDERWLQNDFPNLKQVVHISSTENFGRKYLPLKKAVVDCANNIAKKASHLFKDELAAASVTAIFRSRCEKQDYISNEDVLDLFRICRVNQFDYKKLFMRCNAIGICFPQKTGRIIDTAETGLPREPLVLGPSWIMEGFNRVKDAINSSRGEIAGKTLEGDVENVLISQLKIYQILRNRWNNNEQWLINTLERYDLAYNVSDRVFVPSIFRGFSPAGLAVYVSKYHRAHQFEIEATSDIAISRLGAACLKAKEMRLQSYWQTGLWIKHDEEDVIVQISPEFENRKIVQIDSFTNDLETASLFDRIKDQLRNICKDFSKNVKEFILAGKSRFSLDVLLSALKNGSQVITTNDGKYAVSALLSGALTVDNRVAETFLPELPKELETPSNPVEELTQAVEQNQNSEQKQSVEQEPRFEENPASAGKVQCVDPVNLKPKKYDRVMHYRIEYFSYLPKSTIDNFADACRAENMLVEGPYDSPYDSGKKCFLIKAFEKLTAIVIYSIEDKSENTVEGRANIQFEIEEYGIATSKRIERELQIILYAGGKTPIWDMFSRLRHCLMRKVINKLDSEERPREFISTEQDEFSYRRLVKSHNAGITQIAGDEAIYLVDELLGSVDEKDIPEIESQTEEDSKTNSKLVEPHSEGNMSHEKT